MIKSFRNIGTEDLFNRIHSKEARQTCPQQIWRVVQRKLDLLNGAVSLESLKIPPGNCLEPFKGNRSGQHSIRINDQYRICFKWSVDEAEDVEVVDYHGSEVKND
jgi:proteic killer suppression protein